jgi:hypothetical protein
MTFRDTSALLPVLFSRVLSASRPLLRARLSTYRRTSAVISWAQSFGEFLCYEHGIGGGGECCGDNDAQLGRIIVLTTRFRAASTCPARCSLTYAVRASSLGELHRQGNLDN